MPLWVADPSVVDHYPPGMTADGMTNFNRPSVTATASATIHTPGPWTQVVASTDADSSGLSVFVTTSVAVAGANSATLLEIGLGAAGSEVVWSTLNLGYTFNDQFSMTVPGLIPAGSRVAVRARSVIASKAVVAVYSLLPARTPNPPAPTAMGVNTATSRGTVLTSPTATGVKGAWTEMIASTESAMSNLLAMVGGAGVTTMGSWFTSLDIGIGAGGLETVLISDIGWMGSSAETFLMRTPSTFGVNVPVGSRLSARWGTNTLGNTVDVVLHGC